jgi:hypothetical protein
LVYAELRRYWNETVARKLRDIVTENLLEGWRKTMKNLGHDRWIAEQNLN